MEKSIIVIFVVFRDIRECLTKEVAALREKIPGFQPGLAIVQVGGREDSNVYIRMKIKAACEIGMRAEHVKLPRSTTQMQVIFVEHIHSVPSQRSQHNAI